ncbi:MAG TPA: ATP-binding SpoIIE family protein phosphatase [Longimicrobium sp.]|nr:ATP-binding SpoIIE family protein phosphatase [Longimicrobium sp.]
MTDPSGAGEVRRRVTALAQALRFGETDVGRVALAATEAATNLARHARGGGVVIVRPCGRGSARGVELLAVDRGPGVRSVSDALRDGFSTAGSAGTGLGALSRLSDEFDLFSTPEQGTVLLSRVWSGDPGEAEGLSVGVVSVAKPGEAVCGDGWSAAHFPGRSLVLCVDGLGHGPDAAAAAMAGVRVFDAHAEEGPAALMERMHLALRPTRGAAAAVADVDVAARVVRYAGVGNIAATVWAPGESRSLVSHNGIVGHEMRKVQRFEVPLPPRGLLVMHSDGIATRWQLEKYPGLALRDPAVVAAVLYRDFCRGRDDATVVVARETAAA